MFQLIFVGLILIITYWYLMKPKNLPPGPSGLPLIGYLPWLAYYAQDRAKLIEKLKKYGNIVCVRVGFSYIVFLNDIDTIKEAFIARGDKFSARSLKLIQSVVSRDKGVVTRSSGNFQREHRRFILRSFRNMGFGKISFEDKINESINGMFEKIDNHITRHPHKSFNFQSSLVEAITSNVTGILFGFNFNNEQLSFLIKQLEIVQNFQMILFFVNSFPFLLPLMKWETFQKLVGVKHYKDSMVPLEEMIMEFVKEHKSSFDRNNISDFVYSYIEEQGNHQKTKEDAYWWDDEQIVRACTELIVAATETTYSSICWSLFALANNQDLQQKICHEIDTVIGKERKPSTRDLASLPLCEAAILETLRCSPILHFGVPHSTTEDVDFCGYFIPKDTCVLANLHEVSRNKSVWLDSHNFNPISNFLSTDGKTIINRDKSISFSVGRRSCIGESIARMEMALFFISIFQKYRVSLDETAGMPSMHMGVVSAPIHAILKFNTREH